MDLSVYSTSNIYAKILTNTSGDAMQGYKSINRDGKGYEVIGD
jgi:hypothetical protein